MSTLDISIPNSFVQTPIAPVWIRMGDNKCSSWKKNHFPTSTPPVHSCQGIHCKFSLLFLKQSLWTSGVGESHSLYSRSQRLPGVWFFLPIDLSMLQDLLGGSGHTMSNSPTFPATIAHGICCALVVLVGFILLIVVPITIQETSKILDLAGAKVTSAHGGWGPGNTMHWNKSLKEGDLVSWSFPTGWSPVISFRSRLLRSFISNACMKFLQLFEEGNNGRRLPPVWHAPGLTWRCHQKTEHHKETSWIHGCDLIFWRAKLNPVLIWSPSSPFSSSLQVTV